MKLHQLSVFLENKPGQLVQPARVLAEAGINIVTLSVADTQQFGILRLIVKDWEDAQAALEKAGCVVNVAEVVGIEVPDQPGGLVHLLDKIDRAEINVEYMYAFSDKMENTGVLVFRFEDTDTAIERLLAAGVDIVGAVELYKRLDA